MRVKGYTKKVGRKLVRVKGYTRKKAKRRHRAPSLRNQSKKTAKLFGDYDDPHMKTQTAYVPWRRRDSRKRKQYDPRYRSFRSREKRPRDGGKRKLPLGQGASTYPSLEGEQYDNASLGIQGPPHRGLPMIGKSYISRNDLWLLSFDV